MSISSISGVWRTPTPSAPPPLPTAAPARDSSANGGASISSSVLSSLTPSDRSLIAAATGVVISPDGTVVVGASYVGSGGAADQFVSVIAAARQLGQVQGRITPAELASLFPPYTTTGPTATVDPSHVARAVGYLSAATPGEAASGGTLDARS
ncbi:MAG TPA: hypothetical protein VMV02_01215 [Acidimicrobiales bacterium]|nr:hypothetical protein [Acidimicrobiales bacterium]